ncbi:MAG: tubulin-like doman-containing protein, partial [Anaerolineae bacterium]
MLKQTPVELRQALVIGLGEAGKEVVEQLHLLLKERLEPKADALLDARLSALLDKDLGPVPVIGLMTLEPEYGAETGKLQGGREDGIFRVLLPLDPRWAVGSYEADTEGEGLGHSAVPAFSSDLDIDLSQTRRIGRAAMRAYANQLQDLINDVQGDIRTMDRLDAVRTRKDHNIRVDEPNLEVFLLAALDEPFASGAFLDLAYLVDHVLHFERSDRFNYYTSGILFLPNYTQEGDMGLREADTYAALKELDYYITQRRRYESGYGHRLQFTSMEAPFNRSCYLVEAANEKGRALPDLGQLAAMVSEWLYRYLTTPLSGHFRTHGSEFAWRKSAERVTAYSGLGTASFILSIDEVIEVCAARLGEEMVRDGFRRELAGKERAGPQGRAQAFAGDPISITAERAIQSGRTGEYQDISAKHFENITLWDFRAVRRRVLELFGSRLVHMLPIMKREIQDRVEGALDQVQRALSQEVERLINELPIGGVDRVQIFLERLRGEMASREKDARELAAYSHKQEKEDGTRIAEARAKYRSAVETVEWPAPIWLLVSVIVILAFLGYGLKILWQGLPYLELSVLGGQFIEFHNTHLLAGIVLLLGNLSILGLVGWYGYTWMEGAQGTYISWHVNRLRHSLDKVCYELRGRFFQAMQEVVNEQLVAVTDFRDLLDDLASELEKFRAKPRPLYGTPRFPLEESVLKPEDLKGFYQEVTKAEEGGLEDVIARLMREHGPFYDWRDREPEDLRDMIVAFGKTQMEKLRNRKSAEALLIKHLEAPSAPDQVRLDALAERA